MRGPSPIGDMPRTIVVMGVSGAGKSTIGTKLSDRLACPFLEGDTFHSADSIAKMQAGHALSDDDRWPWLDRLGAAVRETLRSDMRAVLACSALKRSYRERLTRVVGEPILFVHLQADRDELDRRLRQRSGHYMPASLLDSQLAALEIPSAQEQALVLDARDAPERIVDLTVTLLASPTARAAAL